MALEGYATPEGTQRYHRRFAALHRSHVRDVQGLAASSIGCGTYLGDPDDRTDTSYREAIRCALSLSCNVLDTAINYRCQRSERAIGAELESLVAAGAIRRDELLVCTKGGYIPFDADYPADPARHLIQTVLAPGLATYEEIVAGSHCLAPAYLDHSLQTSLRNLRLAAVDVFYLHNPEQQLEQVEWSILSRRLGAAFELLEQRARDGLLQWYGVATWNAFRVAGTTQASRASGESLSLQALVTIAESVGGPRHRFRVMQLPYNLAMPEAHVFKNQVVGQSQPTTVLEAAQELGISVMASASLLQSRLARLPAGIEARIPGLATSAQRALQFVRSTPGITTALVGMKQRAHVEENLALAKQPVLDGQAIASLFDRVHSGAEKVAGT